MEPKLCDPYEQHFVEVRKSQIPNAGQGLFAKNRIERCTVVAFYNGVRTKEDGKVEEGADSNEGSEDESEGRYRLKLSYDENLDIPQNMASIEKYCATLGHKVSPT